VATVAAYVSPSLTEHETTLAFETVVAENVADAACAPELEAAMATPAAASAATTGNASSTSRFLDMRAVLLVSCLGSCRSK